MYICIFCACCIVGLRKIWGATQHENNDEPIDGEHFTMESFRYDATIPVTVGITNSVPRCVEAGVRIDSVEFVNWLGDQHWIAAKDGAKHICAEVVFSGDCTMLQRCMCMALMAPPVRYNVQTTTILDDGGCVRSRLAFKYSNEGYRPYNSVEQFVHENCEEMEQVLRGFKSCDVALRCDRLGKISVLGADKTERDMAKELLLIRAKENPVVSEWTYDGVTYCEFFW